MRKFEIQTVNDGPFKMYLIIDTDCKPHMIISTTSNKEEAESLRDLQQWDYEERTKHE